MSREAMLLGAAALVSAATGYGAFHAWRALDSQPAVLAAASSGNRSALQPPAPADTSGAEPVNPPEPASPAIPELVPDLSLPDMQGKPHSLRSYQGLPTIINFWASWCVPCRREIPLLNEIQHNTNSKKINIVGIAADLESNVRDFLKTTRIDYALLVGEQKGSEAAARFGVPLVLPFSIFVASDGRVVAIKVGELHREEAVAMLAAVRRLDQGSATLTDTRHHIAARLRALAVERAKKAAPGTG